MSLSPEALISSRPGIVDLNDRPLELPRIRWLPINSLPNREGHLTDLRALGEFSQQRKNVFSLIALLRRGYPQETLNLEDFTLFACGLYHLPYYLTLRASSQVDKKSMPPSVIDLSRAADGIYLVADAMIGSGFDIKKSYSVDDIYNFANGDNRRKRNFFIEEDRGDQSCPASEQTVKQILRAMMSSDRTDLSVPSADWEGMVTEKDFPNFMTFGYSFFWFCVLYREVMGENSKLDKKTENDYVKNIFLYHYEANLALGYDI